MYEDRPTDNGVAYNTENFDDDNIFTMSMDIECEGIWEECPYGHDAHKYCQCWKQCREEYETL